MSTNTSTYSEQANMQSFAKAYRSNYNSKAGRWAIGVLVALIAAMFLPWTQNIRAKGSVTTLYQEQRPQNINSPIPGKIAKWFVKEGDKVKKGDTILEITEIKEDYLDPQLVQRTREQLTAKKGGIDFYRNKISTADAQINALRNALQFKQAQLKNKLQQLQSKLAAERADSKAADNDLHFAEDQFKRQQKMFDEGLVSQTALQQRNQAFLNALAKKTTADNKILQTQQEIANIGIEQSTVEQEYTEKISKTEGDKFSSLTAIASSEAEVAKLENQVSNYVIRNDMYIILAPQDGQIVQANKAGIGEIVKEGERITVIVPTDAHYAVEMFVRPVDLPLVNNGQKVRFTFDGFPAIVFSGWPNNSFGTFGGIIVAHENSISDNGLFRVLVTEDTTDKPWPKELKIGSGAQGIALLKDVPLGYELWRNINGFPPDFYVEDSKTKKQSAKDK
jgi:multidrug resistance efflux pump